MPQSYPGAVPQTSPPERVLVVDTANWMGSRPDGWWRDRAGAARRLLAALEPLVGRQVEVGAAPVRLGAVVAVLEGLARSAVTGPQGAAGPVALVDVVLAERDGDEAVVARALRVLADGRVPLVVTADRGLVERLPAGADVTGPGWLNALTGR